MRKRPPLCLGRANRRDAVGRAVRGRRARIAGLLVQLEVHVRRARRILDTRPEQLEELGGCASFCVEPERLEIALIGRDRAVDDRGIDVVLLRTLAERVVERARRLVVLSNHAGPHGAVRPVGEPVDAVRLPIDHQVRVRVDLEVAAGKDAARAGIRRPCDDSAGQQEHGRSCKRRKHGGEQQHPLRRTRSTFSCSKTLHLTPPVVLDPQSN